VPDSATSSGIQAACAALKAALADTPHVGMQVWKEEQLKGPVAAFTRAVAMALGVITTSVFPETPVEGVGRPDLGVTVEQLLCGYIELKAPGKGADPTKFKDRADKDQWSRFRNLPNLIYTDGHALALYRSGQRVGAVVDVDGLQAASTLELVFRDFFAWQPAIPTSAAALARMLAPLCRLLRDEVRQALEQPGKTAMKLLREQWERTLLVTRTADDFADEYAQTLTYALVLARAEGAVSLEIETAAKTLEGKNEFLSQVLRVLAQPKAKSALNTPTSLLQRSIERVDPAAMASKAPSFHGGDPWLYFYEDFLEEYDPERRRTYGVYYTPVPVVQAQVRLVAELLQQHFNRPRSYFDDVMLLDPAVGTGSYPLAALRHAADAVEIQYGRAAAAEAVAAALPNVYAFERFVGPYAIAHLRLTQMALDLGATAAQLPVAGVNVLLADTLSDPEAAETGRVDGGITPLDVEAASQSQEVVVSATSLDTTTSSLAPGWLAASGRSTPASGGGGTLTARSLV